MIFRAVFATIWLALSLVARDIVRDGRCVFANDKPGIREMRSFMKCVYATLLLMVALSRAVMAQGYTAPAPLIVAPSTLTATQSTATNVPGLAVNDPWYPNDTMTFTGTSSGSGTLSAVGANGNGTGTITFTGSLGSLNTLLSTMTFKDSVVETPTLHFSVHDQHSEIDTRSTAATVGTGGGGGGGGGVVPPVVGCSTTTCTGTALPFGYMTVAGSQLQVGSGNNVRPACVVYRGTGVLADFTAIRSAGFNCVRLDWRDAYVNPAATATGPPLITLGLGSLTDPSGNVFTITSAGVATEAKGGSNPQPMPGGAGTNVAELYNGTVYFESRDGTGGYNWFTWNGTAFIASSAPAVVGSVIITNGSGALADANFNIFTINTSSSVPSAAPGSGSFTDSASPAHTWTVSSAGVALENGVVPASSSNVAHIYLIAGVVWQQNTSSQWFYFTQTGTNVGMWNASPTAPTITTLGSVEQPLGGTPAPMADGDCMTAAELYNGTIYFESSSGSWYTWSGTAFVGAAAPPPPGAAAAAPPAGCNSMTQITACVANAANASLAVIFNHLGNEIPAAGSACVYRQQNGLWFDSGLDSGGSDGCGDTGTVTAAAFQTNTVNLLRAFNNNATVIGYEFHNEPIVNGAFTGTVSPSGLPPVTAPLPGTVTLNAWSYDQHFVYTDSKYPNGGPSGQNYMNYSIMLPPGYNCVGSATACPQGSRSLNTYPLVMTSGGLGQAMEGSGPNGYPTSGSAFVGNTLAKYYGTVAFQTAHPSIVVSFECDQGSDGSGAGANNNCGGYGDSNMSGWNERAINALLANIVSNFSVTPGQHDCFGMSLSGIGCLAQLVDNNSENGVGSKLWDLGVMFSGQLTRPGVSNSTIFPNFKNVYFTSICSPGDNPCNFDQPFWPNITGNTNYPTQSTYDNNGIAGIRASTSQFYYINSYSGNAIGNGAYNVFGPLKSQGGDGDAIYNWAFLQTGSSSPATGGSGGTIPPVNWGGGGPTDLKAACGAVGAAVFAVNPGVVLFCPGPINNTGTTLLNGTTSKTFSIGGNTIVSNDITDLSAVAAHPVTGLPASKIAYSIHLFPCNVAGSAGGGAAVGSVPDEPAAVATTIWNAYFGSLEVNGTAPVLNLSTGCSCDNTQGQSADDAVFMAAWVAYANGLAVGGPSFTAAQKPMGNAWYSWGNFATQNPDGTLNADGTLKGTEVSQNGGQAYYWSQLLQGPVKVFSSTTWNPADALNITLSNNNLTATSTATHPQGVRAITSHASGEWCWAVTATTIELSFMTGLANASWAHVDATNNAIEYVPAGGAAHIGQAVWFNNTLLLPASGYIGPMSIGAGVIGQTTVASVSGEELDMCANLNADLFYVSSPTMVATTGAGSWNDSSTCNPTVASCGLSFSGLVGPFSPFFYDPIEGGGIAGLNTIGPFTNATLASLPAGYAVWDGVAVTPPMSANPPRILIFGDVAPANDNVPWLLASGER